MHKMAEIGSDRCSSRQMVGVGWADESQKSRATGSIGYVRHAGSAGRSAPHLHPRPRHTHNGVRNVRQEEE